VSYHFDTAQPVTDNIRRIVSAEVDAAELSLARVLANGDPLAVHDVRKRTKKLRAVAVLVSGTVRRRQWKSVHKAAAEAASSLGDTRDLQVRHLTLVELLEWAATVPDPGVAVESGRFVEAVAHAAAGARQAAGTTSGDGPSALADAAQHASWLLTGVAAEVDVWELPDTFDALATGLVDTYAKGRRRWKGLVADAHNGPVTPHALHRWRRAVKQRWYHTRLLEPLAPDVLGAEVALLDELGQVLGSDHDLAVFIEGLADDPAAWGSASVAVDLAHLADRRRSELTTRALVLGRQVYVDPARVHQARMRSWWRQVHRP
jgi:CHAD domain-containing protein